tara:strand:+ start:293 stop:670 length:378 start_codon:yes stop_codon:yes gene_type:complete
MKINSKPKHCPLMVYMPRSLINSIKDFSQSTGQSVSQVIRSGAVGYMGIEKNLNKLEADVTKSAETCVSNAFNSGYNEGLNASLNIFTSDKFVKSFIDKNGLNVFDRLQKVINEELRNAKKSKKL